MVTSIVTLLASGIAAGAGTHRNRFRPVRARQQLAGAVGPASPTGPVRQEPGRISIAGNGKAHHRQRSKNMPTTELTYPRAEPSTADRTDPTCAVCPHEWAAHDPIGIRFCSATVAGQLHRGCVCVGNNCNEDRR